MDNLYHHALIEQWKHNFDASDYENNLNRGVNIPSIKKTNYINNKP